MYLGRRDIHYRGEEGGCNREAIVLVVPRPLHKDTLPVYRVVLVEIFKFIFTLSSSVFLSNFFTVNIFPFKYKKNNGNMMRYLKFSGLSGLQQKFLCPQILFRLPTEKEVETLSVCIVCVFVGGGGGGSFICHSMGTYWYICFNNWSTLGI